MVGRCRSALTAGRAPMLSVIRCVTQGRRRANAVKTDAPCTYALMQRTFPPGSMSETKSWSRRYAKTYRSTDNQRACPTMTLVERIRAKELTGRPATSSIAALVAVIFMASTLVTPLYVIYENTFHFSRITLTLIYGSTSSETSRRFCCLAPPRTWSAGVPSVSRPLRLRW